MNIAVFFSNRNERLETLKKLYKGELFLLDEEEMEKRLAAERRPARLKTSHKGIPGFWMVISLDREASDYQDTLKLLFSRGLTEEAAAFPPEGTPPKQLEKAWIHKYGLLTQGESEDCWSLFYRECKAHMRGRRFDQAYYGLMVMLKYNPFYLKKYRRFYQFEEMAYHYEEMGNLSKAIKCLKAHLILQPDSVEPYLNMSSFYIINEMEEEAIATCKEALKKNPNNKYLISNLVLALSNLGQHDYAVEYLQKVLQKSPDSSFYWKLMGDLLYEIERNEEAMGSYQRALQRLTSHAPEDFLIDLYNGMAATAYELENYEDSARYYKKVLEHYPSDPYVLLSLSQIYFYKLENTKEALKYGKILLEKAPENGYGHYQIGLIYMKLENFEKAKWHLYRSKKIMPYYEPVLEAIQYLKQVDKVLKVHQSLERKK